MSKTETNRPARKDALVVPTFSIKKVRTGESLFITIRRKISEKTMTNEKTGEIELDEKGKPKMLHTVRVSEYGKTEELEMVLPIIVYNAIVEAFPHDNYVGESFELVKGEAESGKATKWTVYSI